MTKKFLYLKTNRPEKNLYLKKTIDLKKNFFISKTYRSVEPNLFEGVC